MNQIFVTGKIGTIREFSYNDKNGQPQKAKSMTIATYDRNAENNTQWVKVIAFGALKNVADLLYVGAQVAVMGRPRAEVYESKKQGKTVGIISILAQSIDLPPKSARPDAPHQETFAPEPEAVAEDIPF